MIPQDLAHKIFENGNEYIADTNGEWVDYQISVSSASIIDELEQDPTIRVTSHRLVQDDLIIVNYQKYDGWRNFINLEDAIECLKSL